MIVLVTGADGELGSRVAAELASRAHAVRAMTASPADVFPPLAEAVVADLATGHGVPDAVDGVDAIVHCTAVTRGKGRVVGAGTGILLETASRAGVSHVLRPGRVGADVISDRRHRAEVAIEASLAGSGLPWTVLRTTHLHREVWELLARLTRPPVVLVPNDTRLQPIDAGSVAVRLADAAESGPAGHLPDLGGPTAYEVRDLARSYLAANGLRKPILRLNRPGLAGAAMRAGAALTPNRDTGGTTWNDFVAERIAERT